MKISCHTCHAQVEAQHSRIVMADKRGRLLSANKERLMREQGVRPYQWVRLCLPCHKEERP